MECGSQKEEEVIHYNLLWKRKRRLQRGREEYILHVFKWGQYIKMSEAEM